MKGGENMKIQRVKNNPKQYLCLLLLADEQENMIDRYLERGTMYALEDGETVAVCVVTDEGGGVLEIKNIAVEPKHQRKGYGHALINFLVKEYEQDYRTLQVGTGESDDILRFYARCGFQPSHRIQNFFVDHYDHPMFAEGKQLVDMIYLQMPLKGDVLERKKI